MHVSNTQACSLMTSRLARGCFKDLENIARDSHASTTECDRHTRQDALLNLMHRRGFCLGKSSHGVPRGVRRGVAWGATE